MEMRNETDRVVIRNGVSWAEFMAIARQRDAAHHYSLKLHYLDGALELMTISEPHEYIKRIIGRCLEAWSEIVGVDLHGVGSLTIRKRSAKRGAEADESYHVGSRGRRRPPELAIEVIW